MTYLKDALTDMLSIADSTLLSEKVENSPALHYPLVMYTFYEFTMDTMTDSIRISNSPIQYSIQFHIQIFNPIHQSSSYRSPVSGGPCLLDFKFYTLGRNTLTAQVPVP